MKKAKKSTRERYDLQGSIILLHGPPKGGKTQLASSFPGNTFIATEPGHKYIPEPQKKRLISVNSLADLDKVKLKLSRRKEGGTVTFDTIQGIYRTVKMGICNKHNCNHPSERGDFGKTIWDIIGDYFAKWIDEVIMDLHGKNTTVILIDHTKERDVDTATGTVTKVMAGMSGQARYVITGLPDHIWFLSYGEKEDEEDSVGELLQNFSDKRMLWLRGGNTVEAGCRDKQMKVKRICPLKEPDLEKKTGGYYQIIKEMTR